MCTNCNFAPADPGARYIGVCAQCDRALCAAERTAPRFDDEGYRCRCHGGCRRCDR